MFEDFGATEVKSRQTLAYSEARELLVTRSIRGAFYPDGTLARDTIRLWGRGKAPPDSVPDRLPNQDVVGICNDEVVWGGSIVNHYGHFLTEVVSRLWPLLPGADLQRLPVVFTDRPRLPFIFEWLKAFGCDIIELPQAGAVRFTRMIVPDPAWRLNAWVAPEIRDIHLHVRRGLDLSRPPQRDGVLWLSRSALERHRVPYDEALLEWVLNKHVRSVSPEKMKLAEQVAAFESSKAVAGVIGSAFHTILLASELPDVLCLCPSRFQSAHTVQHQLLGTNATFLHALSATKMSVQRKVKFPHGYRLLIPESLRALNDTVLPGLLNDEMAAALSHPERQCQDCSKLGESEMEAAIRVVLIDSLLANARMKLGALFQAEGLDRCALEQFAMVADLTEDYAKAPLLAARLLARSGRRPEASAMAERVLAIDPEIQEMRDYMAGG